MNIVFLFVFHLWVFYLAVVGVVIGISHFLIEKSHSYTTRRSDRICILCFFLLLMYF